jgi:epsin
LTSLILDEERLRSERKDRKTWKSRVSGLNDSEEPPPQARTRRRDRPQNDEEDLEFKLALEASKNEAEEEARRRAGKAAPAEADVDDDLAKAIKLSKEEEELRKRELEQANANLLFDDTPSVQPTQPTGWNQGYQQQPTVDWFGNVIEQQPQNTGYPAQNTGYQNGGYGYPTNQPQMTGYGGNFMQPQQTAFNNNNPYGGQSAFGMGQVQPQQQPQQQQQESTLQPGSNNPWAGNNSMQDGMKPQATGSNNPFAQVRPVSAQPQRPQQSNLNTLREERETTNFNPILGYSVPSQTQPQQQPQQSMQSFPQSQPKLPSNPHHARLNELLSSGEGQDTFGNVGDTRIPSQHTAPGTFVNSAGANLGRLTGNATGNPFMNTQFTGMPQQQHPALTGPAGSYSAGYGSSNPFGAQQHPQHQQHPNGNLIDL